MQRSPATAECSRLIHALPTAIFTFMAEPRNLAAILPRVQRVEVLRRVGNTARVRTHMTIGPIGTFAAEGDVYWQTERELCFRATQPVLVESRWTLVPEAANTRVTITMTLDLTPMLGPLAGFIPPSSIAALIVPDLDTALAALARRVE